MRGLRMHGRLTMGNRMTGDPIHARLAAIALRPARRSIAAHMVTGLIASEGIRASVISIGLVLNATVATDQTVVAIAASVRHITRHMPIAVESVVRAIAPAIRPVPTAVSAVAIAVWSVASTVRLVTAVRSISSTVRLKSVRAVGCGPYGPGPWGPGPQGCCFQNYLAHHFRGIWRSVGARLQHDPDRPPE